MHTVTLPLKTTRHDEHAMNKRFLALQHIHNVMVKKANKEIIQLRHNKEYRDLLVKRKELSKNRKHSKKKEKALKQCNDKLKAIREGLGLSEPGFQSYLKEAGKKYKHMLTSTQVQKEATRVWSGASSVVFGKGKMIHFKKAIEMDTIGGKNATNGVVFDKEDCSVRWLGLHIKCKLPKRKLYDDKISEYEYVMRSLDHEVKYCEIKRLMFNSGWRYYVIVYLDGPSPERLSVGTDTVGIDPGVSSIAAVSDNEVLLQELAPKAKEYNKQIVELQQRMDISRRTSNPENFNEDGTIKKGKKKWKYSKNYKRNRRKLKTLYRKKSEYIKCFHKTLCNKLLKKYNHIIVEKMNFKSLQKRAKETKRQETSTEIKQKDGSVKSINKYKRKKRFGKSLNDRAPGYLMATLQAKCIALGGTFQEIETKSFKASQYNHVSGKNEKIPLKQREKKIGKHIVQRDLYSAFLIRNASKNLKKPHRTNCKKHFKHFVDMQNNLIDNMKANNISMKQCFGF